MNGKIIFTENTITSQEIAKGYFQRIIEMNPRENEVLIDLGSVVTMTTKCARIIFGDIYIALGPELFYKNIVLENCSEGLQLVIEFGIEHAIKQR